MIVAADKLRPPEGSASPQPDEQSTTPKRSRRWSTFLAQAASECLAPAVRGDSSRTASQLLHRQRRRTRSGNDELVGTWPRIPMRSGIAHCKRSDRRVRGTPRGCRPSYLDLELALSAARTAVEAPTDRPGLLPNGEFLRRLVSNSVLPENSHAARGRRDAMRGTRRFGRTGR